MARRKKRKEIITPWGYHGDIAAEVGCHINSVKDALKGKRDSLLGMKIRELALRKYSGSYKKEISNDL
jgi:hypothetical protein